MFGVRSVLRFGGHGVHSNLRRGELWRQRAVRPDDGLLFAGYFRLMLKRKTKRNHLTSTITFMPVRPSFLSSPLKRCRFSTKAREGRK